MADTSINLTQGKTYSIVLRWEHKDKLVYRNITGVSSSAPCLVTAPAHNMLDGWRCAITNVKGPTQLNCEANNVKDTDYIRGKVIDPDTIELNSVNSAGFKPYVSGGVLQYKAPVALTGYTVRMKVRDKKGGTLLASSELADAPLNILDLLIDPVLNTVTLTISAENTAALLWKKGVYEIEMVSSSGDVDELRSGAVTVSQEIVT